MGVLKMSGFITEIYDIKLLFQAILIATDMFLTVPYPLRKTLGARFPLMMAEKHNSYRKGISNYQLKSIHILKFLLISESLSEDYSLLILVFLFFFF